MDDEDVKRSRSRSVKWDNRSNPSDIDMSTAGGFAGGGRRAAALIASRSIMGDRRRPTGAPLYVPLFVCVPAAAGWKGEVCSGPVSVDEFIESVELCIRLPFCGSVPRTDPVRADTPT